MRWILVLLLLAVAALGAAVLAVAHFRGGEGRPIALPEDEMRGRILVGFQDDASFRWAADRGQMLDHARAAGAAVIRTTVVWASVTPRRPVNASDPFDRAYQLDEVDDLARNAQQRGIELLITIWGTPGWANGGQGPNHAPENPDDLEDFAQALATRYSGRHAGYPAVRLFSAWNEPNLEQFLAPQFDSEGRSASPALYAPIARAICDGVKRGNPDALVAIGETSPRGHDLPSRGAVQDSHSPARFARLLSEQQPSLRFDAWAQHPYPPSSDIAPASSVRWPRVGLGDLGRFGESLDEWFGRDIPLWLTEYAHETSPAEPLGVEPALQARYAEDAIELAAGDPRVRMFIWFILRDSPRTAWQSGLVAENGTPKPALASFTQAALRVDGRNPVLPEDAHVARVPALELAFQSPAGSPVRVEVGGHKPVSVPLGRDGWIDVPVDVDAGSVIALRATNQYGSTVVRNVQVGATSAAAAAGEGSRDAK